MSWRPKKKGGWSSESAGRTVIRHIIRTIWEIVPGGVIRAGKTEFLSTEPGFWLGIDADGLAKFHVGNSEFYMRWTGTGLDIVGTVGGYIYGTVDSSGTSSNLWTVNQDGTAGTGRLELQAGASDKARIYYDGSNLRLDRNIAFDTGGGLIAGVDITDHAERHGHAGADAVVHVGSSAPAGAFPGMIWIDTS